MLFKDVRIEFVMPMFTGLFCSLFFCAVTAVSYSFFSKPAQAVIVESEPEEEDLYLLFKSSEEIPDPILEYFRNLDYREWVIGFFAELCSNDDVAQAILINTDFFNVPPALAFALCWEESRFNPRAINRENRNGSVDRGLFQLNNRSFPNLDVAAFLSIDTNAHYGVGHLRYCLDTGGSEISALAMYNAGAGRVKSTGAPEVTLNYISRILGNRRKIESRFHSRLIKEEEERLAEEPQIAEEPPAGHQLFFNLAPQQ